jgi:alkylation response protein AidB-like acyl-CoA dehydrogenase
VDFTFDEDQLLFQATLREFLAAECTPELLRGLWAAGASHSPALWAKLAALGVPGMFVPESHQGMGLGAVDAVLLFEEFGRAALAEPVIATAGVAVPLLLALEARELRDRWLPRIAAGEALVAVGQVASPLVPDADVAHLLLLPRGDELHAVPREDARVVPQPANDPSRRLFTVDFAATGSTRVAAGAAGRALQQDTLARGALFAAAEQLGVCDRLLEMASGYACQRRQFGQPIGSFQAVKHMLADAKVRLEYARPVVQRAAWSLAQGASARGLHASLAKVAASDAAGLSARVALQVHGAIGYTWEQDLHIWMRRAWSLEQAWGRSSFHRQRVEEAVLRGGVRLGPGETFRGD